MKKQSGRSMVEMLGTLAIIGVLSVTALTGYKIAMTKNRTNNILYDVNLAMNEIATREYMSLPVDEEAPVSTLGVKTEFDISYARLGDTEENGFYIVVDGVTEEVCETLLSNKTAFMAEIQPYNNETALTSCTGANAVLMKFPYPPIEGGEVVPSVTCWSNYEVINGVCCYKDYVCGNNCCENGSCQDGVCYSSDGSPCPDGTNGVDTNGFCCTSEEELRWGDYGFQVCCPKGYDDGCCPEKAFYVYEGDYYVCCSNSETGIDEEGNCISCPNETGDMPEGNYQRCCTDDEFLIKAGSYNVCCPKGTTSAEYDWTAASGYRCYDADGEELCPGVKNIYNGETYCCSTSQYFKSGSCTSCPSGKMCDGTNIVGCTDGYILNTYNGETYCCSTSEYFKNGSCYSCPSDMTCNGTENRTCSDTTKYFRDGSCYSCPSGMTCDGTANPQCSDGKGGNYYSGSWVCCSTNEYFNGWSCSSCPSDAICDGTADYQCSEGYELIYYDWDGMDVCCPIGTTKVGFDQSDSYECCDPETETLVDGIWGSRQCCTKGYDNGCCPEKGFYVSAWDDYVCCSNSDTGIDEDGNCISCPNGTGDMPNGNYQRCCTNDESLIKVNSWMNVCCPKGATSAEDDWSADSGYRCYDADGEEL